MDSDSHDRGRSELRSSSSPDQLVHKHNTVWKCVQHSLKGALLGFFGVVVPLTLKSWRKKRILGTRTGLAFAVMFGGFRALVCTFFSLFPSSMKHKQATIGLSAFISTYCAALIEPDMNNPVLVIWTLLRGIRPLLPNIPFGAAIGMVFSASILLRNWIINPKMHAPSYKAFLDRHGGYSVVAYRQLHEASPMPIPNVCVAVHPNEGHFEAFFKMFWKGIKLAFPVYLPVHLLSTAFSEKKSISVFVENMIRSTVFLSGYCATAWLIMCTIGKVSPGFHKNKLYPVGLTGLWVLLERPSRQVELTHYCMTHALNALWNRAKCKGLIRSRPEYTPLLLATVVSLVLAQFNKQPKFIVKILFGLDLGP